VTAAWVIGLTRVSRCSQVGRLPNGYSAPERKTIGRLLACDSAMKDWSCRTRAAAITPIDGRVHDSTSSSMTSVSSRAGAEGTPTVP
jgi:hypothetical protein